MSIYLRSKFKVFAYTFRGDKCFQIVCALLKGFYAKIKEFPSCRVDPFSGGTLCAGEQSGSYISCLPCKIKALTALADRLSLSVGWENGSEQRRKTVSFNPLLSVN